MSAEKAAYITLKVRMLWVVTGEDKKDMIFSILAD
jgi:hypothetical protein